MFRVLHLHHSRVEDRGDEGGVELSVNAQRSTRLLVPPITSSPYAQKVSVFFYSFEV
jgi:hypothetical protein